MTTRALLYRPKTSWRVGVAFGAAALIHFGAIALANVHRVENTGGPPSANEFPEITLEPPETVIDPPAQNPDPLPTPPPQVDESFPEDRSTPPPLRRQINKMITPIRKPSNHGSAASLSLSSAKVLAVSAPPPEYPYEARRQRITGNGVVTIAVDPASGRVSDVSMLKSTGNPFLDNAAITGFRRWRFKPGTLSSVTCPITFTLTGATY